MKIAILGYGVEGQASYDFFAAQGGHELTICDQNSKLILPEAVSSSLGENYLSGLDSFDLIMRSPSLAPSKILERSPGVEDKISSQLNEFLKVCPSSKVIGVTGTKGKGTTSTLIAKMLEASGKKVFLGGNIGVPLLSAVNKLEEYDFIVLELSSFQLVDLKQASPHIAVCLMVVPEHLDWHGSFEDYVAAKSRLFSHQSSSDIAIYYSANPTSAAIAEHSPGQKLPYYQEPGAVVTDDGIKIDEQLICQTSDIKLLGEHNLQNICAAVTSTWQITQDISAIKSVLASFSGLPHRLEFVREVGGVRYYNDSFAATPDAAIAAMQAIEGPKVMILGGFERKLPLKHLAQAVADKASELKKVLLIGASAQRLAKELETAGFTNFKLIDNKAMTEIVHSAQGEAAAGDSIVLSPGFASFDMFKNFEDRGQQFKEAVSAL